MKRFFSAVWSYVKAAGRSVWSYVLRYPLAAAATVFLVVAAVAVAASGKTLQIGGLLGRLWGSKKPDNLRAVVPEDRKDADGNPVLPGKSDDLGFVQVPVSTEIKPPGMFDDPGTITVLHPEKGEVKLDLPTGVRNQDVREVIEVSPDVFEVRNKDKGVDKKKIDDVLKKF